jgi:hypothetical protein
MFVPRRPWVKRTFVRRLQQMGHPVHLDKARSFIYVTKMKFIPVDDLIKALQMVGLQKVSHTFSCSCAYITLTLSPHFMHFNIYVGMLAWMFNISLKLIYY